MRATYIKIAHDIHKKSARHTMHTDIRNAPGPIPHHELAGTAGPLLPSIAQAAHLARLHVCVYVCVRALMQDLQHLHILIVPWMLMSPHYLM
jgi:hypothetical protein